MPLVWHSKLYLAPILIPQKKTNGDRWEENGGNTKKSDVKSCLDQVMRSVASQAQ